MKAILKIFVFIFLTVVFISCKDDESTSTNNTNITTEEFEFGSQVLRDFIGVIKDESGIAISNASVKIGTETVLTDSKGVFIIKSANVQERLAYIKVNKIGYLKGLKTVVPTQGVNNVAIVLLAENIQVLPANNQIQLLNGTKVTFNGGFEDASGNTYLGAVNYSMNYIDPASEKITSEMPGMLLGKTASNDFEMLETYGMLHVSLTDTSGNPLQIASGDTAEIRMPIPALLANAPATIPLWSFDEGTGYWVEDGFATKIGNEYVGSVSHFSWWNCDANFATVSLCLNVEDSNGNPLANMQVDLTFEGYPYPRTGISNDTGEICGLIPANETLILTAYDDCGNSVYTDSIGPFTSNTDQTIVISGGSVQSTVVTGNFLDCSNNPVTDGYVEFNYGINTSYQNITNGVFEIGALICNSNTNVTIEGVDYNATQSTGLIPFILMQPVTNIGTIISCNAVDEYITYQVDNNPVITRLQVSSYYNSNSGGFNVIGEEPGTSNEIFFSIHTTNTGVYTLADFYSHLVISEINLFTDTTVTQNFQFVITNYGAVGDYIDLTFSGDYVDGNGVTRSITGTIHVRRDS